MIWGYHHFRNPPHTVAWFMICPWTSTSSGSINLFTRELWRDLGEGPFFGARLFCDQRCWWLELVGGHGSWMWCLLIQLHGWLSFFDFLAMAWRSGVTLGTLSRTLDDRRCLWSWHRGCWGVLRGSRAEREENWQKRVGYWFFEMGFFDSFFVSCSFSCSVLEA